MERQKFEESWTNAFEQAEVNPSSEVWTNVELELERQEGGKLKRRILFYKMLAAASVVFAMAVAGVGYYNTYVESHGTGDGQIAQNTPSATSKQTDESKNANGKAPAPKEADPIEGNPNASAERDADNRGQLTEGAGNTQPGEREAERPGNSNEKVMSASTADKAITNSKENTPGNGGDNRAALAVAEANSGNSTITTELAATPVTQDGAMAEGDAALPTGRTVANRQYNRQLPQLARLRTPVLTFYKTEPDRIDLWLAGLTGDEKKTKKESREETLWTAVGFSAGAFNALTRGGGDMQAGALSDANYLSAATGSLNNETSASGISYSVGLNVGGKVAKRWVLQGGVNYMTNYAEFTSNAVVTDLSNFKAATSVELNKLSAGTSRDKVVPTAPYSVTSNLEYVSVPVQAGYLLVNRAFGIQINGGVSTDMFIQSKLTPKGENLDAVSQSAGKESPYRTINFSGLLGTEFTYKFASHYRVSLNPGIRYPLNSIYKSDIDLESTPLTFDIGLRFRYIFQ